MTAKCEAIERYPIVRDGQVVMVTRYEPTKADAVEGDTSRLSFYSRRQRLNSQPVRDYLKKEGKL
jgi:hypothetical protein